MRVFAIVAACVVATAVVASLAQAYAPVPPSCSSSDSGQGAFDCSKEKPATIDLYTGAPVFVKAVKNGKRYLGGTGNDTFHIAHLYSDTDDLYEMGFALGQLFPKEMDDMFATIEPWLVRLLEKSVSWLPDWMAQIVVDYGVPVLLDIIYDVTAPYIPPEYLQEWQGMADGANISIKKIRHIALFPQASKAACTAIVAHKNATAGGGVQHLRALDFDPTSLVADFASVVIHHYKTKPQLANFAWIAMPGCLTCMNDVPISVGEKKGGRGKNAFLPFGLPWMQMLRQSLELDSIAAVNKYIVEHDLAANADPNTVAIHLAYGDQKSNDDIGYEIGYNYSRAYHWDTHTPAPTHPLFENIVYWTKNDDAHTMCPADMLTAQYGNIDAEWLAMYYSPNDMTGDTQVAGFDLANMKVYLANSAKSNVSGPICAYYRTRTLLDMKTLFAEQQQ